MHVLCNDNPFTDDVFSGVTLESIALKQRKILEFNLFRFEMVSTNQKLYLTFEIFIKQKYPTWSIVLSCGLHLPVMGIGLINYFTCFSDSSLISLNWKMSREESPALSMVFEHFLTDCENLERPNV